MKTFKVKKIAWYEWDCKRNRTYLYLENGDRVFIPLHYLNWLSKHYGDEK